MKATERINAIFGFMAGLLCGVLLWCALYLGLSWIWSAVNRADNPADYVTASDAYILVHQDADTRRSPTPDCANWGHVPPSEPALDTERILHVANDVPDRQRSALKRIWKWNPEKQTW